MNAINYDDFFDALYARLTGADSIDSDLALTQLLIIISEPELEKRRYAAETIAEALYEVQACHAGRGLERYEDMATRINQHKQYPAELWATDAGLYLCGAVENFFQALEEHRADVAAQADGYAAANREFREFVYDHARGM